MAYYLWAVGSGLPGLRLAVVFVDIQSFPESSRLHQLGAVAAPGAAPGWFCGNGKPQLFKTSIVQLTCGWFLNSNIILEAENQENPEKKWQPEKFSHFLATT